MRTPWALTCRPVPNARRLSATLVTALLLSACGGGGGGGGGSGSAASPPASGSLDASFGTGGKTTTNYFGQFDDISSIVIQPDGRLVAAGATLNGSNYNFALARYNVDGSPDLSFDIDGMVQSDIVSGADDGVTALAIQTDGKIVAAGYSINSNGHQVFTLARYNTDGSLDTTFSSGTGLAGVVRTSFGTGTTNWCYAVAIQSDGKIVAAGSTTSGGTSGFALARYNTDGSLDTGFGVGGKVAVGGSGGEVYALALQSDGKIVVVGDTYDLMGTNFQQFVIARYNNDGTLDTGFGSGGQVVGDAGYFQDVFYAVAIQPDGKILATGYTRVATWDDVVVARYNTDGTLDTGFGGHGSGYLVTDFTGADVTDHGQAIAVQADGKIVVAGWTEGQGGPSDSDFALARYNSDGSLDPGFGSGGTSVIDIAGDAERGYALVIQADGRIVAAGQTFNGFDDDFALVRMYP